MIVKMSLIQLDAYGGGVPFKNHAIHSRPFWALLSTPGAEAIPYVHTWEAHRDVENNNNNNNNNDNSNNRKY